MGASIKTTHVSDIVKNKIFQNTPTVLTEKAIRKYFPHCEACPASNMAQQPMPGSINSDRELIPGDEIELDIKVYADNSKQRKHKRAIGGYTCALTAIDLATDYTFGYLL